MKIYFAGSIRGGRDDKAFYFEIIKILGKFGTVLTEHVGALSLGVMGEEGKTEEFICERDLSWIKEADVLVAEVTVPSLGVGYEIAKAEDLNKPILCLFRENSGRSLSAMIAGSKRLTVRNYKELNDTEIIIKDFFKKYV